MKFALDTVRNVSRGPRDRKIHALFTFAIWFAAAGYVISSLGAYIQPLSGDITNIVGALLVSALISVIKFT